MARQPQSLGRAAAENNLKRKAATTHTDEVDQPQSKASDPLEQSAKKRRASSRPIGTQSRPLAQTPTQRRSEARTGTTTIESDQSQHDANKAATDTLSLKITELKEAGTQILTFSDSLPDKSEAEVHLPVLNLEPLKLGTSGLPSLDDSTLYGWLLSNDILPCLKQFALEMSEDEQLKCDLDTFLLKEASLSRDTIKFLAQNAPRYVQIIHQLSTLDHPQRKAAQFCLKHLRRLKRCTTAHPMYFLLKSRYPNLEDIFYMLCAGGLVTVYTDLRVNKSSGFFWTMFDTRFAEPMVSQARQAWDKLLILPGSTSGADTASSVAMVHAVSVAFADERRQGAVFPALGVEVSQDLQDEVKSQFQELQSKFAKAMSKNPELMTIIPPETGHIEPQEPSLRVGELVGFPPRKKGWYTECDHSCKQNLNLHTAECGARTWRARKQFAMTDGEGDADGAKPSFTFQVPFVEEGARKIPPGLNSNRLADPFTEEEALAALKRFRAILSARSGPVFDSAFQWTSIAEVLAGRSVADCIRFYNVNKQIIDRSVATVSGQALPLALGDELESAPFIKELYASKVVLEKKVDSLEAQKSKAGACVERLAKENEDLHAEQSKMKAKQERMEAEQKSVWETNEFLQMENCQGKIDREKLEFDLQMEKINHQSSSQKLEKLTASVKAAGHQVYPEIEGFGFLEGTLAERLKRQWQLDQQRLRK